MNPERVAKVRRIDGAALQPSGGARGVYKKMSATQVNYGYSKPLKAYLLLFQKVISKMETRTKTTENVHEGMLELGEYSLLVRSHALCSGAVACLNSACVFMIQYGTTA